jgi:hypothetical protein
MEYLADEEMKNTKENLAVLRNEIKKEIKNVPSIEFEYLDKLNKEDFNREVAEATLNYLNKLFDHYQDVFIKASSERERRINYWIENDRETYLQWKDTYTNESVSDIVKKVFEKNPIVESDNEMIQQIHPIYNDPNVKGFFDFRSHFFAPRKHFMGMYFDTYWFNVTFIWLLTIILYITLYYEALKKLLNITDKLKRKK